MIRYNPVDPDKGHEENGNIAPNSSFYSALLVARPFIQIVRKILGWGGDQQEGESFGDVCIEVDEFRDASRLFEYERRMGMSP